jgi:hypothetical protein
LGRVKRWDIKIDEGGLLAGEFKGIPSRREQPNNCFKHTIKSSFPTGLILRKATKEE